MKFQLINDHFLQLNRENKWIDVELKSCFPITQGQSFYSISDSKGKEIALIESLADLEMDSQSAIKRYLKFKNFIISITKVHSIEEEFGIRSFVVETDQGPRNFQMDIQRWPKLNNNSVSFEDISGDRYVVKDLFELDTKSKKILADFID